jgi:hypothetical protein
MTMRLRRWAMALMITLMLIDAWMQHAVAATRPRPDLGPGTVAPATRP